MRPLPIILVLFALYILFPTQNHSVDAWGYAANIKWSRDLWHPHHLLYGPSAWRVLKTLHIAWPGLDAMRFLLFWNALGGTLTIWTLWRCLKALGTEDRLQPWLLLFAGTSFGFWRFCTENEVYVWPILLSGIGTLFFIKHLKEGKGTNVLLSGFFAALACLFHQMHIFWWLGLLAGGWFLAKENRLGFLIRYALPAAIIPVVYFLAFLGFGAQRGISVLGFWRFIMHDVVTGQAGYAIGLSHFTFGVANLLRTFFQVHGMVGAMLKQWPILWLIVMIVAGLVVYSVFRFIRGCRDVQKSARGLFILFMSIFILQYLFAVYNVGNAEFMAMLPFLLALCLGMMHGMAQRGMAAMSLAALLWNGCFGAIPLHGLKLSCEEQYADMISKDREGVYMLTDRRIVENVNYYQQGHISTNTLASPSVYFTKYGSYRPLRDTLQLLISQKKQIYTDAFSTHRPLSRGVILAGNMDKDFLNEYDTVRMNTACRTAFGRHEMWKVKLSEPKFPERR